MATFLEAMVAARAGKRVRQKESTRFYRCYRELLIEDETHCTSSFNFGMLTDNWIIEQPSPREYTFMEAVEMMKRGKVMMTCDGYKYRIQGNKFIWGFAVIGDDEKAVPMLVSMIEGKWVEVE